MEKEKTYQKRGSEMSWVILSVLSSFLNACAQVLIKKGSIFVSNQATKGIMAYANGYLFAGFFLYGISAFIYLKLLEKVDVSVAYPVSSIGYIFIVVLSFITLGESFDWKKMIGIFVMIVGMIIMTRK